MRAAARCLLALLLLLPASDATAALGGIATVRDGDSLEVQGQQVRLYGVDAPEARQVCQRDGTEWRCGQAAERALAEFIAHRPVWCRERDRDRYGRVVATCLVGGDDVAAWLVREGWALAYRRYALDYVDEEAAAKAAKRGLWQATFTPPWEWRARQREGADTPAADRRACRIKGNVSRKGARIYHVPGDRDYAETRIDPARGERWFCSEAAARAAGWRRSAPR